MHLYRIHGKPLCSLPHRRVFRTKSICWQLLAVAVCYRHQLRKGKKASSCSTRKQPSTGFETFISASIAPGHFARRIRLSWRFWLGWSTQPGGTRWRLKASTRWSRSLWWPRKILKPQVWRKSLKWLLRNWGLWDTWRSSAKPKTRVFWWLPSETGEEVAKLLETIGRHPT